MCRELLILIAAVNVAAFFAFGVDKLKARRGSWRTPEAYLLLLAFAAGFCGAWLGMWAFRHKIGKTSFRWKLILVTVVNLLWPALYLALRS